MPAPLRAALVASEQDRQRCAEALIAERIAHDMEQLEVIAPLVLLPFAADVR